MCKSKCDIVNKSKSKINSKSNCNSHDSSHINIRIDIKITRMSHINNTDANNINMMSNMSAHRHNTNVCRNARKFITT